VVDKISNLVLDRLCDSGNRMMGIREMLTSRACFKGGMDFKRSTIINPKDHNLESIYSKKIMTSKALEFIKKKKKKKER